MTSKFPVGNISVVTLIRTDTTLDHSQKAEKVCADMRAGTGAQFALVKASVHRLRHFVFFENRGCSDAVLHDGRAYIFTWCTLLVVARKQAASREILLWMTPSEAPKALQASECSELLDPMRASCWISAQH